MEMEVCDRCDSKIAQDISRQYPDLFQLQRRTDEGDIDTRDLVLCSMCYEDMWDWALGEDAPDRSGMADPVPLDFMADSVERHVESLEDVLERLEAAKGRPH